MSRTLSLSAEVSRCRALMLGGVPAQTALRFLESWAALRGGNHRKKAAKNVFRWHEKLCAVLGEVIPLGAPVGKLLRAVQPMILGEEKHSRRLAGLEKQFGFQGAIAVVLPWAVVAITGKIEWNLFTGAGLAFQVLGIALFVLLVSRAASPEEGERERLFDFLVSVWMRVLAGSHLKGALESALASEPSLGRFERLWHNWTALGSEEYQWPPQFPHSRQAAEILFSLLKTGAPSSEVLGDLIVQLEDDRRFDFEERLAGLPVRLSLVFCAFFAPSVFLLLMGGLWPDLSASSL